MADNFYCSTRQSGCAQKNFHGSLPFGSPGMPVHNLLLRTNAFDNFKVFLDRGTAPFFSKMARDNPKPQS